MTAPLLPSPTPDWALERYALGVLPPELAAEVATRLSSEPGAADRLRALPGSDREILHRHPPRVVAATLSARYRRARFWRWSAPAALAVAALALLTILPGPEPGPADVQGASAERGTARAKGPAQLLIVRRGSDGDAPLTDGDAVATGDHLQLAARSPLPGWAVVVSLDGDGEITVHTPRPLRLDTAEPVGLTASYRLDDAPAFERFFLVTGADAPTVRLVVAAVEALSSPDDALVLPPELSQISLTLFKIEEP